MNITLRFFLSLLVLTSLSNAFASSDVFNAEELKMLAKERWNTIAKHKFGEVYNYETPTYRAVFTKDLFENQFSQGVDWNLTKIDDIKYDPATNVATVIVVVETKPKNSKELDASVKTATVEIREKWLHIKGRWWHSSSE